MRRTCLPLTTVSLGIGNPAAPLSRPYPFVSGHPPRSSTTTVTSYCTFFKNKKQRQYIEIRFYTRALRKIGQSRSYLSSEQWANMKLARWWGLEPHINSEYVYITRFTGGFSFRAIRWQYPVLQRKYPVSNSSLKKRRGVVFLLYAVTTRLTADGEHFVCRHSEKNKISRDPFLWRATHYT